MADSAEEPGLAQAWQQCYLDPARAAAIGHRLADAGGADAAWGWWHVALAEARRGQLDLAHHALACARSAFADDAGGADTPCSRALCDEVEAIWRRASGDAAAALQLHEAVDAQGELSYTPLQRFIAHNSRAITHKVLGRVDDALRHFVAALNAAESSSNVGARITALSNLGGYQQDLYNLDDARAMSEQAFALAREQGSQRNVALAANNLIITYHALGETTLARDMARFLVDNEAGLAPGVVEPFRTAIALGHASAGEFAAAEALLLRGTSGMPGDSDGKLFRTWVSMRCALARSDAATARRLGEGMLKERRALGLPDLPFDLMELHQALADACERLGDAPAALACMRHAHALYAQLVGRSARARRVALEVGFELAQAQRERDQAIEGRDRSEHDRRRLSELNDALRTQMAETERLHERLREQALHDPLTGLHNRRYLFESAPGLLELARRQGTQTCVVLIDLDHFKRLNDSHGHQAGDAVLKAFAQRARAMLRRSDLLCRHGGEEFVAVMPDIDAEGAYLVLGRLLEACLAESLVPDDPRMPLSTFSAGIALFPQHGDSLDQLLQRADLALYAAKGQGRARIEIASHSGHGALN